MHLCDGISIGHTVLQSKLAVLKFKVTKPPTLACIGTYVINNTVHRITNLEVVIS